MPGPDVGARRALHLPRRATAAAGTTGAALALAACGVLGHSNRGEPPIVLAPEATTTGATGDMSSPSGSATTSGTSGSPTAATATSGDGAAPPAAPAFTTVVRRDLVVRTQNRTRTATVVATVTSVPPPVTRTETQTSTVTSVPPPVVSLRTVTRTSTVTVTKKG